MNTSLSVSMVVLASVLLSACPPPGGGPRPAKPDLIITELLTLGPATVNSQNEVEVPVRVVARNQGGVAAGPFKVSMHYRDPQSTLSFVVAFTVAGAPTMWYPYTTAPLGAGAEATFEGRLTFHSSLRGVTVPVHGVADSCSGDEFMPEFCRVDEAIEGNNRSATDLTLTLP